jgi:biotin carboxylase
MGRPRILILGASRYYIYAIKIAKEMGYWTLAIDRNPNAPGLQLADEKEVVDITNIPAVIDLAKKYKIDGILALNDFGVQTAAEVSNRLGLPGLPLEVARVATNKALMRKVWQGQSFNPEYRIVRTLEEAKRAVYELDHFPLIFKPADSRGGASRGVSCVFNEAQIEEAFTFAQSFYSNPDVVIEHYIEGLEHSLEAIVYRGEIYILAISDKVKTPLPYRVDKSVIYPTILDGDTLANLENTVKTAIELIGITSGIVHVELCTSSKGVFIFEMGARCGGGGTPYPIVPWVAGVNELEEAIRLAIGEPPKNYKPVTKKGCVYHFLTPKPGRLLAIYGLEEVRKWPGILDADVIVPVGGEVRPVRTGSDRAGFVIAGADTRQEALILAGRAEREMKLITIQSNGLRK